MSATISINPLVTTTAAGSFNTETTGYIQGTALADPSARNWLAGGILKSTETLPMWGGVAISETSTPVGTAVNLPRGELGGYITRATNISSVGATGSITGFSVFDQNSSMINSPQSPVPLSPTGGQVNFYRFGSNARLAVNCVAGLVNSEGVIISQQLSWDFSSQQLIPYSGAYPQTAISGAVWAATLGGQTTYTVGTDLTTFINAGDVIEVSGVVNTGGASTGAFNGQWVVVSLDATHIVVAAPASVSLGTYASGGNVLAGGGALPVRLLDVQIGNSMVVSYDATTGFATWNRAGNCAIILI